MYCKAQIFFVLGLVKALRVRVDASRRSEKVPKIYFYFYWWPISTSISIQYPTLCTALSLVSCTCAVLKNYPLTLVIPDPCDP